MGKSIVVVGVSGCGKSTIGSALAARLGMKFIEADDLHSCGNKEKMSRGDSLTDEDRWPWLMKVTAKISEFSSSVCACSALKREYRDFLRQEGRDIVFIELSGQRRQIEDRLVSRPEHFMSNDLLDDQLATLEPLQADEPGFRVRIDASVTEIVTLIVNELESRTDGADR